MSMLAPETVYCGLGDLRRAPNIIEPISGERPQGVLNPSGGFKPAPIDRIAFFVCRLYADRDNFNRALQGNISQLETTSSG